MPKMLWVFFLHHRELLGGLCRAGWEVVRELMATAVGEPVFRPGLVAVVQTYGDMLGWHPHVPQTLPRPAFSSAWVRLRQKAPRWPAAVHLW